MPNGAKECFKPKLPKENEDVERNSRHADLVGFLNGTKALPSRFLDHYRLGELLGDGAFGFVMTATRLKDNLEVAVKFIASNKIPRELWVPDPNHPHLCKIPNEIKILQTLNHPNIIKYIDHIIEGPYILLITELHGNEWTHSNTIAHKHNNQLDRCDGDQEKQIRRKTSCDLFECIDKRIPEPLARKIFAQIAFAVNYLHERNLVHRDLKDENIVIDANYAIKIIDFGSVATIPQRKCDYFTRFNGTIHFASPEITNNQPYRGPEAEMWSMGVLLYTMVFGENPFHNPADIIRGDFRMPFDAELESDKDGEGCRHLIKRLLTYNQNDRATMEEVLHHKWMRDEVVLLKAKYGL
ncbi:kinase-like domain-containing protein [Chytriomyces sp. MP71]|nr:kinase-like domain-containing protein [Chytriomyces sp. MP71]